MSRARKMIIALALALAVSAGGTALAAGHAGAVHRHHSAEAPETYFRG